MKKLLLMAAVVAVGMSSCSKNEVVEGKYESNVVTFDTYTGISAKGTILENSDLQADGFGVLAYDRGSVAYDTYFASSSSKPNFMYNEKVYQDAGVWTYATTKYWSSDESNMYSFFAYAPYNDETDATPANGITLAGASATGVPYLNFTVQDAAVDMVDFVAGQVPEVTKSGNGTDKTVSINFKHQLTRVQFFGKSGLPATDAGVSDTYVSITKLRLLGTAPTDGSTTYNTAFASTALYSSAEYVFDGDETDANKISHEQDGTWNFTSSVNTATKVAESYDTESILNKTSLNSVTGYTTEGVMLEGAADYVTLFDADEYLFLIPPYGSTGIDASNTIMFEVVYDVVTVDSKIDGGCTVSSTGNIAIASLPETTLKQGQAYNIYLTITGTNVADPTDPTDPGTESAFDKVVVTGKVIDWNVTDLNNNNDNNESGNDEDDIENENTVDVM